MRNVEDRSGVAVQCLLQDFLGCDIQMVGRLIEDQEVGLGEHQLCERDTTALTTGEGRDQLKYIIVGKKKGGEHVSDLCLGKGRVGIGNFLKDGFFRMQYVMLLIVIADLNL